MQLTDEIKDIYATLFKITFVVLWNEGDSS